jgi:hypothetical protein
MRKNNYLLLFVFFSIAWKSIAQYDIHCRDQGFSASLSLVVMFTSGAKPQDGLRWGAGLDLSQAAGNFTFSSGFDVINHNTYWGLGVGYIGVKYDDTQYGASCYLTKYFQADRQMSGIVNIHLKNFKISFEDDILAYPFVGFKVYDRYRTAAMEIRYKGFLIGTNIYSTDIDAITDFSFSNPKGKFKNGKQISSPVYVGYEYRNLLLRAGVNNKTGGYAGQNFWHRFLFQTPDFNYGEQNNFFLQIGIDKFYTLY